jgi:hypothetical protein
MMGDFFQSSRRTTGLVALGMALVFLAGWLRSQGIQDVVSFPGAMGGGEYLMSLNGSLVWQRCSQLPPGRGVSSLRWFTVPLARSRPFGAFAYPELKWWWNGNGIGIGKIPVDQHNGTAVSLWVVSYWYVIAPLTLLSGYLLLGTRRGSTGAREGDRHNFPGDHRRKV